MPAWRRWKRGGGSSAPTSGSVCTVAGATLRDPTGRAAAGKGSPGCGGLFSLFGAGKVRVKCYLCAYEMFGRRVVACMGTDALSACIAVPVRRHSISTLVRVAPLACGRRVRPVRGDGLSAAFGALCGRGCFLLRGSGCGVARPAGMSAGGKDDSGQDMCGTGARRPRQIRRSRGKPPCVALGAGKLACGRRLGAPALRYVDPLPCGRPAGLPGSDTALCGGLLRQADACAGICRDVAPFSGRGARTRHVGRERTLPAKNS